MSNGANEERTSLIRLGELFHAWAFAAASGGDHHVVYDSFLATLKPEEQQQLAELIHASEFWRDGLVTADTLAAQEIGSMRAIEGRLAAFIRSDNCSHDDGLKVAKEQMCHELWGSLRAARRRQEMKKLTGAERMPPTLSR